MRKRNSSCNFVRHESATEVRNVNVVQSGGGSAKAILWGGCVVFKMYVKQKLFSAFNLMFDCLL